MKRRVFSLIGPLLIMMAGLGLLLYPFVSDIINQRAQSQTVKVLENRVRATPDRRLESEKKKAEAYNRRLLQGTSQVTDPFDSNAVSPSDIEYDNILNLNGDGVMGELIIPKISVNLPILHRTVDASLTRGSRACHKKQPSHRRQIHAFRPRRAHRLADCQAFRQAQRDEGRRLVRHPSAW